MPSSPCSATPPGLLCSPTRPSSDLGSAGDRERTAVIVVWLIGGASHLETYDPKPLSGSEYRGPYLPIATRVPGLDICELLPRHAEIDRKSTRLNSSHVKISYAVLAVFRHPSRPPLFPYPTLFRSGIGRRSRTDGRDCRLADRRREPSRNLRPQAAVGQRVPRPVSSDCDAGPWSRHL